MANQYKNKVVYDGDTLIDLTEDTVTTDTLLSGTTAHDRSGAPIRGTYTAPVTSVNGQTGDVALVASDVGALPSSTAIPSKTSDLTNDSGYITGMVILSYGISTWQDFIDAYNSNAVVYCRASSKSNPATGAQTRMAFMAYVNSSPPTEVEFQYYRSVSTHTASQQGDQVFVYKLNKTNGWSVTLREAMAKIAAGTNMSSSYSNGTLTLNFNGTGYASSDLGITGSSVGDAVIVKTVDTNGVPTSFESGEIGGGADTMVVNVIYNSQSQIWETDKTFAEIYTAYQNGSLVYMVNSSGTIFDLDSVSASTISFCHIIAYSDYIQRSMYSIGSNNRVVYDPITMAKPTLPSGLRTNPILLVTYDDSQNPAKYVIRNDDIGYISEVFNDSPYGDPTTTVGLVTLQYTKSSLSQWESPPTNAEIEEYKLVEAYTTYVSNSDDPSDYDNTFYGHLVFSKVGIVNGQVKLKTFTVENDFTSYITDSTVTYSETSLSQAT